MPSDLSYAHEKYSVAVNIMATSDKTLRERLYDAFVSSAHLAYTEHGGLGPAADPETQERLKSFHQRMTSTPAVGDEGTIAATINAMTDEEVQDAARELVEVASVVEWAYRHHTHG